MKKTIMAAVAVCATALGSANAASVTLDLEGVAAEDFFTFFANGAPILTQDGFAVTARGSGAFLIDGGFSAFNYGATDTAFVAPGQAIEITAGGAAFDLTSFVARGRAGTVEASFSLAFEYADGTGGTLDYAVTSLQNLAPALKGIVRAVLTGTGGTGSVDDFAVEAHGVPVPGAALLFGPAMAGLAFARRRADA